MHWNDLYTRLSALQAGCKGAWDDFDPLFRSYLAGLAAKEIGQGWPELSCSDVVQDTLQLVCKSVATFVGGPTPEDTAALFRAWLVTILRHRISSCREARNTLKRLPPGGATVSLVVKCCFDREAQPVDLVGPDPTPSSVLGEEEQLSGLAHALAQLTTDDRRLIERLFFEHQTHETLAKEFNMSIHQIRYRKDKILETLGLALKEH